MPHQLIMFAACPHSPPPPLPTHTLTSSHPHTEQVDHIVVGTVIQEVKTSNVAREVRTNTTPIPSSHFTLSSHPTHSPHRLQWSQGSRTTFPVTQSQWHASPPTLPLQQVNLFLSPHTLSLNVLSPHTLPPHTHTGVCQIASGQSDVVIAGGVDFMSDVPIRLSRGLRKTLLSLNKVSVYPQDTISTFLSVLSIWDLSFLRPKL